MATTAAHEGPASRPLFLTALTVQAVMAAAAFGRVYQGQVDVRLAAVAGASVLLAGALERRHVLLAAAASAAALAFVVGRMVLPDTTAYWLPTLSTARAGVHAFAVVGQAAALQVAPAPPIAPLLLAGLVAVWTAGFASHALAVRARSPFLALAPSAALMAFAGMVMHDGSRPGYVVPFLAAGMVTVFADGLRRVGSWGPLTVWHGRRSHGLVSGTPSRSAGRVAAAGLVIAAFFPWILPGFHSGPLLDVRGGKVIPVSIDPIVDIRPRLLQNPSVQLFTVRASSPDYWRFLALDVFDGNLWKPLDPQNAQGEQVVRGDVPVYPYRCTHGQTTCAKVITVRATFRFDRFSQPWLPAPAVPTSISLRGTQLRYGPVNGSIVLPDGTFPGLRYTVTSVEVKPTPAQLNSFRTLTQPGITPFYTELPPIPRQILQTARAWTAGATTPYEQILDIERRFRTSFAYSLRVPAGHGDNAMLRFLSVRRGYCEQFAGTMAVMLRALGIPARVAVGFTQGAYDPTSGLYRVRSSDAHSWVEVLFPQYGWLPFEPTPGSYNPVGEAFDGTAPTSTPGCRNVGPHGTCRDQTPGRTPSTPPSPGGIGARKGYLAKLQALEHLVAGGHGAPPATIPRHAPSRAWLLWAGLALLALALAAVPAWKAGRRRAMLLRPREPGPRVLGAYRVFLDVAGDLGFGRSPAETPREFRARLEGIDRLGLVADDPAASGLARLTALADRAAYAANGVAPAEAHEAIAAARALVRSLRDAAGWLRRVLGWFRLAPFERAAGSGPARAPTGRVGPTA